MNGGAGRRVYGLSSTERTANSAPSRRETSPRASSSESCTASAFSCPSWPKSRPCATRLPSSWTSRAANEPGSNVPSMSQYAAAMNSIRSRSRSTTSRVATDCTRPADSRGITFFQSTGETS